MASLLAAIGRFLGELFKHLLPFLVSKWQQPQEVVTVGNTEELDKAIDDSIARDLADDTDDPRVQPPGRSAAEGSGSTP